MTIKDLFDHCDNINLFSNTFILNEDKIVLVWNKIFDDVPCAYRLLEIDHYKIIDDDVLIWIV